MAGYIPTKEAQLLSWSANLSTELGVDPATYGTTMEAVGAFQVLQAAFANAYATATTPTTRTGPTIEAKNEAKAALIAGTRPLVQSIQVSPVMTNTKRDILGIPIRDYEPTPIGVPTQMPKLTVTKVTGRLIGLQLMDQDDEKRRPVGVMAANLFSYAGDTPPADLKQWTYEGSVTLLDPAITIAESVSPGTTIWLTALWMNPRLQPGPACTPITTKTNYDGLSMNQAA